MDKIYPGKKSDIFFTSFVTRQNCFDLINSQLRKYKKQTCKTCELGFYPLWDHEGNWITDPDKD